MATARAPPRPRACRREGGAARRCYGDRARLFPPASPGDECGVGKAARGAIPCDALLDLEGWQGR